MSDPTTFTERQAAAWPEAVAEVQRYTQGTIPTDPDHGDWAIKRAEESRPGRGYAISAFWLDGEHVVQIMMDVYGYKTVSVAETCWLYNSADEDCDCEPCTAEREADRWTTRTESGKQL